MPVPAAADAGRRDFARLVLLAAAYLLVAPWGFMLAPLAGLLLVSHPGSRREWMALAIAVPLLAASLAGTGGLFEQFVRAAGMILAGSFVILMLWRPGPFLRRAALATAATAVLLLAWGRRYGVGWNAVQADAARLTGEYFSAQAASPAAQGESGKAIRRFVEQVGDAATGAVPLYPAILALGALGGLAVAWRLYHRLAGQPIAGPTAPFREFRFSDQLVWVPVLALAVLLLPVADTLPGLPVRLIAQNLLVLFGALYSTRGLAVFWTVARYVPRVILLVVSFVALFLTPFALSGLALLGLADSWVDFRRRMAPPSTGGVHQ